jgi:hypothetical protein
MKLSLPRKSIGSCLLALAEHRYKEFTDDPTNAHVPELCLER